MVSNPAIYKSSVTIPSRQMVFLLVLLLLLGQFSACTEPRTQPQQGKGNGATIHFPRHHFTEIYAARLRNEAGFPRSIIRNGSVSSEVETPMQKLSPAHRADVGVALYRQGGEYFPGRCFEPRHAIVWMEGDRAVEALILCFGCNTFAFDPPSELPLSNESMSRFKTVFSELGLLE